MWSIQVARIYCCVKEQDGERYSIYRGNNSIAFIEEIILHKATLFLQGESQVFKCIRKDLEGHRPSRCQMLWSKCFHWIRTPSAGGITVPTLQMKLRLRGETMWSRSPGGQVWDQRVMLCPKPPGSLFKNVKPHHTMIVTDPTVLEFGKCF